jgi:hypothetical protein
MGPFLSSFRARPEVRLRASGVGALAEQARDSAGSHHRVRSTPDGCENRLTATVPCVSGTSTPSSTPAPRR